MTHCIRALCRVRAWLPIASLVTIAAVLAGILLAGCSNNPYPPGETARKVLYRAISDDPRTLDPSVSYTVSEGAIIDVIYPAYFRYHYLKRAPFVLELNLGAQQPVRTPCTFTEMRNGKRVVRRGELWTFRIRRGVRFQDDPCFPHGKGREVTAADIIYSFRRMADPSVPCPVRSFFQDKVVGMDEYVASNVRRMQRGQPADYHRPVQGLQLDPHDPYTFRILLNQPYPQLRYLMAMHFTTPQAHEAVEYYGAAGLARHPVGCGPFVLAEYKPRQRIVLRKNPSRYPEYYPTEGASGDREAGLLADAGRQLPLVDEVVYTYIREDITGWNLFLQGYQDSWGVTQTNYQQVMSRQGELSPEMRRRGIRMFRDVSPNIMYFAFNMRDPVFGGYTPQKRKLRQAISLAIDANAFIDLFSQGMGRPAQFLIPPGIFGYDPAYRNPYRQYNPQRAKQLLAEAGYPGGIDPKTGERLVLHYDNAATTAAGRQFVSLVQKQIEAIGIKVESRSYRDLVWQQRVDNGEFQFINYGWLADYPDPENFVFLLYGPNKRPGPNSAAYNSPEYNRLFEQMRAMDDGPQRLAIIKRMRDIAVEDCPWIFLQHDESLGLAYHWLHNIKPHPVANDSAKYLRVDPAERVRAQLAWNKPDFRPPIVLALFMLVTGVPAVRTVRRRRNRRIRVGNQEAR